MFTAAGEGASSRSAVRWALLIAVAVLCAAPGWSWWPLLVGIGLVVLVRLVLPLIPASWRPWPGPAVLVGLLGYLLTLTSA
ncbi:hypothetical protein AB0L88_39660 [Saccharopolyspora shandongensis]|uniref:hypothetical protein n=1 Tax=Saccharopolyspora shandongensis TaxID=418495 RepID=UPI00343C7338